MVTFIIDDGSLVIDSFAVKGILFDSTHDLFNFLDEFFTDIIVWRCVTDFRGKYFVFKLSTHPFDLNVFYDFNSEHDSIYDFILDRLHY